MEPSANEAARLLSSRRRALSGEGRPAARGEPVARCPGPEAAREIVEIDAALGRIADGTYGTCEACGGAIGRDRLRALPEVRRCQRCSA